ncbi:Chaperone DnaJ-domain-containing protein [Cinnamomum micranthum f. kanehirae]|uniref:Chaperone DnaJ-domain-containing protein n=1 Tax=Cinnamomum micranthum f. kanehirae TaxID=337451 RepID=A0A3S3QMS2_9MAGN|nr:Chaperone DnaJ-domain-containing protein [Cinnamomum micranthum f. kanehirae]
MQVERWRNMLMLRNYLAPPSSHSAPFHSTPISLAKWKSKWNSDEGRGSQPSKNYVRYATRQKRADGRKSLKDLLSNTSYKLSFQDEDRMSDDETISRDAEDIQPQPKKSSQKAKPRHNRNKRKWSKDNFGSDYDVHPETVFQATFGNRCFTWSFRSWEDSNFQNSTFGFEWRENSDQTDNRRVWETSESDNDEATSIGLYSDRVTLGLPPTGPLKIEDVKNAFRASALKWHPDKHLGPSKEKAEEKFKLCVNAYKSLCNAL